MRRQSMWVNVVAFLIVAAFAYGGGLLLERAARLPGWWNSPVHNQQVEEVR